MSSNPTLSIRLAKPVIYSGLATRITFRGAVVSALAALAYLCLVMLARLLRYPAGRLLKFSLLASIDG